MEDAQFVEGQRFRVEDVARIFRLPRSSLNAEDQGDIEQETLRLLTFGIGPRLSRIASAVRADLDLFGDTNLYPEHNVDGLVRTDAATKDQIYHQKVQDGRLLVDEARAEEGLPPLPDGAGQVPQLTPVGGAPNNNGQNPPTDGGGA
jgi:HK97 family phage portal protein